MFSRGIGTISLILFCQVAMGSMLQSDQPAFGIKPELESKRGQRGQRRRCLGVLLTIPASVAELSESMAANWARTELHQKWLNLPSFWTFVCHPIECLPCWVQEGLEAGHALPLHRRSPSIQVRVRSWGSLQPCCVTHGPPWAVCWQGMKPCVYSRGRSLCIRTKAIIVIKNVACKSWPNYALTLSREPGLQRGREEHHQHNAERLLLPKDHEKLKTQILNVVTGVRLQSCPCGVHSHTPPTLRHTIAVRLRWLDSSPPCLFACSLLA